MLEVLSFITTALWSISSILVLICIPALAYKPKKVSYPTKNLELVIITIANYKVRNSLYETIRNVEEFSRKYSLWYWIVIDEGAELENELKKLYKEHVIIVPKNYKPYLSGKVRAINYFVRNYVNDNKWYSFLDDDNLILTDDFLYEIPYYENKGYVATNPILVPRYGKSIITFVMDSIRYFDDLLFFRFFTGVLKRPLIGLHGELLTAKGSVLKEVGWEFRTLTEDFRFAGELVKRGYKTWQSRTKVSIKSPNSIGDLLKQRGRWFKGISSDVMKTPPIMMFITSIRLLTWILGIFASWAVGIIVGVNIAPWLTLPGGFYYWFAYIFGLLNYTKRYSYNNKKIVLGLLFTLPIIGTLEGISWIFGLRIKKFIVIDKN
jgi:cellulose synthase/poly-beta-1,6-N-acetylglucosamine synthase-like glycosyltransferase